MMADPGLVVGLLGYVLGSVPFGLILTRLAGLGDIRAVGSGNIGATNVLRTGRKGLAAATLLLDGGKGALAALGGAAIWPADPALGAAIGAGAAVLGHCFPVWLRFRGGKGVATALGAWLGLAWPVGLAACAVWLAVAALARMSSLSALVAITTAPGIAWGLGHTDAARIGAAIALVVIAKHHANIRRLYRGEEPRIGR